MFSILLWVHPPKKLGACHGPVLHHGAGSKQHPVFLCGDAAGVSRDPRPADGQQTHTEFLLLLHGIHQEGQANSDGVAVSWALPCSSTGVVAIFYAAAAVYFETR